jgi:murein DD-endopeptidase MepM/ murein hydrolase activator NlpD
MAKNEKKLIKKLKSRYRLVIINDTTFEEKFSFSLTPLNVFTGFSSFLVFFTSIITLLIVFTPLREYIPGYTDSSTRQNVIKLLYQTDSLERVLQYRDEYYANILNILNDKVSVGDTAAVQAAAPAEKSKGDMKRSAAEEKFVREYESQKDNYNVKTASKSAGMRIITLYPPVKGKISKPFLAGESHTAIDIVTPPNEAVKAVMDGRIIFASWNPETGHVIAIQHKQNLISIYKHNASILKKYGTFVRAGEPIAIVGNSGELTTGPHLHFELWENGQALNPELFIKFN